MCAEENIWTCQRRENCITRSFIICNFCRDKIMAEHEVRMEMRNAYKILDVKPDEKKSFRRTGRWKNAIKIDVNEVGYEGVDSTENAQDILL
jgi:hypothetical protein